MSAQDAVGALLARIGRWWQRGDDLHALDGAEIERIAADLSIDTGTLKDLGTRGPGSSDLLYERMRVLGMSKEEVDRAAEGFLRDLQRTCVCCDQKRIC